MTQPPPPNGPFPPPNGPQQPWQPQPAPQYPPQPQQPFHGQPQPYMDPKVAAAKENRKTVIMGMSIWVFGPFVALLLCILVCCGGCMATGMLGSIVTPTPTTAP